MGVSLNPVTNVKRIDALRRRIQKKVTAPPKPTGHRGTSAALQQKAEADMRRRAADHSNKQLAASRPPGKALIRPSARLDTSQIEDRRRASRSKSMSRKTLTKHFPIPPIDNGPEIEDTRDDYEPPTPGTAISRGALSRRQSRKYRR